MPEMTSALIIDDNQMNIEILKDLLINQDNGIEIIGTATSGDQGIELIQSLKPELIFLDVEMPGMNGFEMLAQIPKISFQTIFVTSFSKYAISAIRFNALDYLLKPIDPNQLQEAISRYYESSGSLLNQKRIRRALKNISEGVSTDQVFYLSTQEGELGIKLKEIVKLQGDRNYSKIFLDNGQTILSSKNLRYFEERLAGRGFKRCHRSFIINRQFVEKKKGDHLILENGDSMPISRRKKAEVVVWLREENSEDF